MKDEREGISAKKKRQFAGSRQGVRSTGSREARVGSRPETAEKELEGGRQFAGSRQGVRSTGSKEVRVGSRPKIQR